MRKILLLLLLIPMCMNAQYVNPYVTAGSHVIFWPYTYDGNTFLVMEYTNNSSCHLSGNSIVKFKMMDGSIMRFDGLVSNSETNSAAFQVGYTIIGSSSTTHSVAMPISKEQIEKFKDGVDKISINTLPVVYKRSKWSGRKTFGEDLYSLFQGLKDDFEE